MPRITVDITEVLKTLGKVSDQSTRAMKAVVSDAKRRAPGWISKAIRSEYTVEPSEIKKALRVKQGGHIPFAGVVVDDVILEYTGRMLTPIHFKMAPKSRPKSRKYSITVEIKRGQRQRLMGKTKYQRPAFLASAKGSPSIPWQREGKARLPIVSVKTLSVPQMVQSSSGPKPNVERALKEGLEKRLIHQFNRLVLQ